MTHHTLDRERLHRAAELLAGKDRYLQDVHRRLGPPPMWKRPATFATLVRIILEQQVSLASAKSTFDRLASSCCGRITAAAVAALDECGLRDLGFSRQKARYTIALADDVQQGHFRIGSLRHQNDTEVRRRITERLGLGDWSADVFLLMALCRCDIFPVGDLALVKGMAELDGGSYQTADEVLTRAECWRPYRSVATRMVWQLYLDNRK